MITTEEASHKINLSSRQIRLMAKSGRIPGAKQLGGVWLLPDDFSIIKVRRGRPSRNEDSSDLDDLSGLFDIN